MKLRITTGLAAPSLIKQGLGAIASVKEAGFPTEMIDADCIKKHASKPVAAVSKINEGILFCDPNDIGARGFSKDVELALQLEENLVRFELFDFDDQYQDGLQLASRDGQPIQITIANLSVPSFSSGAHDHSKAYGALLKQGGVGALGLGCQPTRMVRDFT